MPPLMAAEVVGESSEDDETLAVMDRILPSFWNTWLGNRSRGGPKVRLPSSPPLLFAIWTPEHSAKDI